MFGRKPKEDKAGEAAAGGKPLSPRNAKPAKPKKQKPPYTAADLKELEKTTVFDAADLNALGAMYRRFTTAEMSTIPVEKARDMPETSVIPLFQRVVQLHNTDKGGFIEFTEFAHAMSALSPRATLEDKLRFVFTLFDMNGTGTLETPELFQLLRMTMGQSRSDRDLQRVCDDYLRRFPNGMTYNVFVQLFDVADLNKLTLNLSGS